MGVLSLQGFWEGVEGWDVEWLFVNISKHNTHLYCGTSVTHPNTHTGALSTNEWNRSEHIEECYYHAQLSTVSSKHMLAEHLLGRISVIDKA